MASGVDCGNGGVKELSAVMMVMKMMVAMDRFDRYCGAVMHNKNIRITVE